VAADSVVLGFVAEFCGNFVFLGLGVYAVLWSLVKALFVSNTLSDSP